MPDVAPVSTLLPVLLVVSVLPVGVPFVGVPFVAGVLVVSGVLDDELLTPLVDVGTPVLVPVVVPAVAPVVVPVVELVEAPLVVEPPLAVLFRQV